MPQFDAYSFSGQVFWTLTGFYLFFFWGLHSHLTQFSALFKMRQKLASTYIKEAKIKSTGVNTSNFFNTGL
jgi:hypothetical protein|tara:strand:- start:614 stop:826 length:213 start_codon:yes stop_codon:yes gene_type:complete